MLVNSWLNTALYAGYPVSHWVHAAEFWIGVLHGGKFGLASFELILPVFAAWFAEADEHLLWILSLIEHVFDSLDLTHYKEF